MKQGKKKVVFRLAFDPGNKGNFKRIQKNLVNRIGFWEIFTRVLEVVLG